KTSRSCEKAPAVNPYRLTRDVLSFLGDQKGAGCGIVLGCADTPRTAHATQLAVRTGQCACNRVRASRIDVAMNCTPIRLLDESNSCSSSGAITQRPRRRLLRAACRLRVRCRSTTCHDCNLLGCSILSNSGERFLSTGLNALSHRQRSQG